MKKTLITAALAFGLSAVASAASITTDTTPIYDGTGSSYGIDTGIWQSGQPVISDTFTYTFTLNTDYLAETMTSSNVIRIVNSINKGENSSVTDQGSGVALYKGAFVFTTLGPDSDETLLSDIGSTRWTPTWDGDTPNLQWSTVDSAAMTVTYSGNSTTGSTMALTLVSEGTSTTYYAKTSSFGYSSGDTDPAIFNINPNAVNELYLFDDEYIADKTALANLNASALVPEPATASLSLLGLAALMMRRRRA